MALFLSAAAGGGLITLSGLAWATPTTVAAAHPIQVRQTAAMTYAAGAPRGAAYPTGQVRTGDPVFLRLVPTLDVQVSHRTRVGDTAADGTGLTGSRRLTAEVRSSNGWHRGFELLPRAAFAGSGFDVVAPVDLRHVRALIAGVEKSTGVSGKYTLSVRSEIALRGTIRSGSTTVPFRDTFFPELTFAYDDKQLQLTEAATPSPSAPAPGTAPASGTASSPGTLTAVSRDRVSTVEVIANEANHLGLLGLDLPVGRLRTGGLAAGLALLAAAVAIQRTRRNAPGRLVRRITVDDASPAIPSTSPPRTAVTPRTTIPPRTAALSRAGASSGAANPSRTALSSRTAPQAGARTTATSGQAGAQAGAQGGAQAGAQAGASRSATMSRPASPPRTSPRPTVPTQPAPRGEMSARVALGSRATQPRVALPAEPSVVSRAGASHVAQPAGPTSRTGASHVAPPPGPASRAGASRAAQSTGPSPASGASHATPPAETATAPRAASRTVTPTRTVASPWSSAAARSAPAPWPGAASRTAPAPWSGAASRSTTAPPTVPATPPEA